MFVCACGIVVCVMITMDGMSTWIESLLDHVSEMVLEMLKEFSWCCSNVRVTGRNGDTVWCVFVTAACCLSTHMVVLVVCCCG